MTSAENWKSFFADWPADFPRGGVIITTLNETIPFKQFWLKGNILLIERTLPDATGGRFLMMGFEAIVLVKMTAPLREEQIDKAGFTESGQQELAASPTY